MDEVSHLEHPVQPPTGEYNEWPNHISTCLLAQDFGRFDDGGPMADDSAESMTSFNHYAYGSVGAWFYRSLAGIRPSASDPGYGRIVFAPVPGGGIASAEASVETPYESAAISWRVQGGSLRVEAVVPPGATGDFRAPPNWFTTADRLGSGCHSFELERR